MTPSEQRLIVAARQMLEYTRDCVFMVDRGWRFTYLNRCARETLGRGEDLLGAGFWDRFPAAKGSVAWERMNASADSGEPAAFEFHLPELDSWFECQAYPVDAGMHVFFRDISARKRDEMALRQSEELLKVAQSGAGAGVWDLDLDTRRVQLCARSMAMFGCEVPDGQMSEVDFGGRLHPDDPPRVTAALSAAVDNRTLYRCEFRMRRDDGAYAWILGLGRVVEASDGTPLRFVGLNLDVTEQKRAEDELIRAQSELVHVSRLSAMGAMASTLAHELNQPLTAIANYVQGIRRLLINGQAGEDGLDTALTSAAECAVRAGEIVRRLREHVSRAGEERRDEHLPTLIDEACVLALVDARSLGIDARIELHERAAWVVADRIQIQQVLLNLVRNAVEAMAGSERRELLISTHRRGDNHVEIRVTDSGPGFDPVDADRLFESFHTTKEEGMGVGLSICRTIVENHHGRIWGKPLPQGGAQFGFTLPRGASDRSRSRAMQAETV